MYHFVEWYNDLSWFRIVPVPAEEAQAAGVKVSRADFIFPDWEQDKNYVQKKK